MIFGIRHTPFDIGNVPNPGGPRRRRLGLAVDPVTGTLEAVGSLFQFGTSVTGLVQQGQTTKAGFLTAAAGDNPCVTALNAQIAQIPHHLFALSAQAKADRSKRDQLEAQRDAYLANPTSCPGVTAAQAAAAQTAAQQQSAADTYAMLPYIGLAGTLIVVAGLVATAAVMTRGRGRR